MPWGLQRHGWQSTRNRVHAAHALLAVAARRKQRALSENRGDVGIPSGSTKWVRLTMMRSNTNKKIPIRLRQRLLEHTGYWSTAPTWPRGERWATLSRRWRTSARIGGRTLTRRLTTRCTPAAESRQIRVGILAQQGARAAAAQRAVVLRMRGVGAQREGALETAEVRCAV